jgi:hypothetical protein
MLSVHPVYVAVACQGLHLNDVRSAAEITTVLLEIALTGNVIIASPTEGHVLPVLTVLLVDVVVSGPLKGVGNAARTVTALRKIALRRNVTMPSHSESRVRPVLIVLLVYVGVVAGGRGENVRNAPRTATVLLKTASMGNVIMPSQMESRVGPMQTVIPVDVAKNAGDEGENAASIYENLTCTY